MKRLFIAGLCIAFVAGALLSLSANSAQSAKQPIELVKVVWLRNFDKAQSAAAELNRPLLVLFQEVPG
jgi:hypothetical protein